MSEVINKSESTLGDLAPVVIKNKIEDYQLEDLVMTLFNQDFKPASIATKCNKTLKERTDNKVYVEINQMNVSNYLRGKRKEMALAVKPEETSLGKNSIDLVSEVSSIINVLQVEIDKVRNPDEAIKDTKAEIFIRMIRELRSTLELVATVQGRMQPSISIAVFSNNIKDFCDKISKSDKLTPEFKELVINLAVDTLMNDDLLKPSKGVEIKHVL